MKTTRLHRKISNENARKHYHRNRAEWDIWSISKESGGTKSGLLLIPPCSSRAPHPRPPQPNGPKIRSVYLGLKLIKTIHRQLIFMQLYNMDRISPETVSLFRT